MAALFVDMLSKLGRRVPRGIPLGHLNIKCIIFSPHCLIEALPPSDININYPGWNDNFPSLTFVFLAQGIQSDWVVAVHKL